MAPEFSRVFGVDFSGAKAAGRNIWIADTRLDGERLQLEALDSLETLCSTPEREPALAHLVKLIEQADASLWGIDFPFGLPIEVVERGYLWNDQLRWVAHWPQDAAEFGRECLRRAKLLGGANHIRRSTDTESKSPFDCYHYRIIYQTFHGMRDVLGPLSKSRRLAVLPFQYRKLATARQVVVEACPGSTLKRLGLPHQNYKQPTGSPLEARRRKTRHRILEGLIPFVNVSEAHRRVIMRNPGGDALDAVIAAVGALFAFRAADHRAVAAHARYPLEGRMYI